MLVNEPNTFSSFSFLQHASLSFGINRIWKCLSTWRPGYRSALQQRGYIFMLEILFQIAYPLYILVPKKGQSKAHIAMEEEKGDAHLLTSDETLSIILRSGFTRNIMCRQFSSLVLTGKSSIVSENMDPTSRLCKHKIYIYFQFTVDKQQKFCFDSQALTINTITISYK